MLDGECVEAAKLELFSQVKDVFYEYAYLANATQIARDNVELIASGLKEVTPEGLVTDSGRRVEADVIIYCTGYKVQDFDRIEVLGPGGRSLAAMMAASPEAYRLQIFLLRVTSLDGFRDEWNTDRAHWATEVYWAIPVILIYKKR